MIPNHISLAGALISLFIIGTGLGSSQEPKLAATIDPKGAIIWNSFGRPGGSGTEYGDTILVKIKVTQHDVDIGIVAFAFYQPHKDGAPDIKSYKNIPARFPQSIYCTTDAPFNAYSYLTLEKAKVGVHNATVFVPYGSLDLPDGKHFISYRINLFEKRAADPQPKMTYAKGIMEFGVLKVQKDKKQIPISPPSVGPASTFHGMSAIQMEYPRNPASNPKAPPQAFYYGMMYESLTAQNTESAGPSITNFDLGKK